VDGHEVIEQMEHIYRTEAASSDDDANSYEGPQHDPADLAKDH
jgi:hypothetical protein